MRAAEAAARGKRFSPAARFFFHLERQLLRLHEELASKTYRPGPYRTFTIYEGKTRQISAAPFRDRVVHHALTGALEPIFERSFGSTAMPAARARAPTPPWTAASSSPAAYRYVLKADVRKFFPSIDHAILKGLVARKIKDPHVLWLVDRIIDHSNPQDPVLMWFPGDDLFTPIERRRGLPLGNQTSQFFANVYLDPLDHFVTDRLGLSYVRYVDDFLVFADDKRRLHEVKGRSSISWRRSGSRSTGTRASSSRANRASASWAIGSSRPTGCWPRRTSTASAAGCAGCSGRSPAGRIGFDAIRPRIMSWLGHARHANTYRLRSDLFRRMPFQRATTKPSSPSGRDVQQSTGERPLGEP